MTTIDQRVEAAAREMHELTRQRPPDPERDYELLADAQFREQQRLLDDDVEALDAQCRAAEFAVGVAVIVRMLRDMDPANA